MAKPARRSVELCPCGATLPGKINGKGKRHVLCYECREDLDRKRALERGRKRALERLAASEKRGGT